MNAAALFHDAARSHPDRVAFFSESDTTTFDQLRERVARTAGALHERGFGPGDRALIMLPMSVSLYASLLAVLGERGVAVFVDPWVSSSTMLRLARHAHPKAWLGSPRSHLLRLFIRNVAIAPLSLRRFQGALLERVLDAAPDDPALITLTTGSSGNPKGVNRTHGILVAQHERLAAEFPARDGDVDLCSFPVFALNNLALGVPTVIPPVDLRRIAGADPHRVASLAARCGVTTATASPPLFDALASLGNPPRLRRLLTGGAPVTDAQLRTWRGAWPDAEIIVAYGSSEAEPVAHVTAEERLSTAGRGYLAGRIVDGVRAAVAPLRPPDARGEESMLPLVDGRPQHARPGEIGELLVAGDHVCREYEGDPAANLRNKLRDAEGTVWHRMGDTGYFDEEERFWIAGRVHSTIWRNGHPLHAQLLEQAARGDDARILRAAAVGIEGEVVLVIESALEASSLAADVKARLEAAGHPYDRIVVTSQGLPLDPRHNSKIDYETLASLLAKGKIR